MLEKLKGLLRREVPIFNITIRHERTKELIGRYHVMDSGRILPKHFRNPFSRRLRTYNAEMGANLEGNVLRDLHFPSMPDKIINPDNRYEEPTRETIDSGRFYLYQPFLDSNIPSMRCKPEYARSS